MMAALWTGPEAPARNRRAMEEYGRMREKKERCCGGEAAPTGARYRLTSAIACADKRFFACSVEDFGAECKSTPSKLYEDLGCPEWVADAALRLMETHPHLTPAEAVRWAQDVYLLARGIER